MDEREAELASPALADAEEKKADDAQAEENRSWARILGGTIWAISVAALCDHVIDRARLAFVVFLVILFATQYLERLPPRQLGSGLDALVRLPGMVVMTVLFAGLFLMPGSLAFIFSKFLLEHFPAALQRLTLIAWLVAIAGGASLLYSSNLRRKAACKLRDYGLKIDHRLLGWKVWLALYLNFVLVAIGGFAAAGFALHSSTNPLFVPAGERTVDLDSLSDFLVWQLLDAIPALHVTETLKWVKPLDYSATSAGWLLLLFKVTVTVPVISGIGRFFKAGSTSALEE
jgi:hypothetical protein